MAAPSPRDDAWDFANGLYARGMYDLAADEYRSFLSDYPDDPEVETARFRLAECLYMQRKYGEALPIYAELARSGGARAPAAAAREGMCLAALGRPAEAVERLSALPEGVPAGLLAAALYTKAEELGELGRTEEELAALRQAAGIAGGGSHAFLAGMRLAERLAALERHEEAQAALRALMEGSWVQEQRASAGLRLAEMLYERGEYERSLSTYDEVLGRFADTAAARRAAFGRLWPLYALGRDEEVLREAGSLLERFPNDELVPFARYMRGSALFRLGRYREAIAELSKVETAPPGTRWAVEAASKIGWAELALGEPELALSKADSLLRNASLAGSKRAEAHLLAGQALSALGRSAEAAERFRQAVEADPLGPLAAESLYRLGFALDGAGKAQEAVRVLSGIARDYPSSPYAEPGLLDGARVALAAGLWEEAEEAARSFLERWPDSRHAPAVLQVLGTALYNQGRYEEMAAVYEELLKLYPTAPEAAHAHYWLGWDAARRGEPALAAARFEAVVKDFPDSAYRGDALLRLGIARIAMGEEPAAAEAFLRVQEENLPLPDEQALWLGRWLLKNGDPARAREVFSAVEGSTLDPEMAQAALAGLGEALRLLGDVGASRETFERLLERYPEGSYRGEAHLGLGRLARRAGLREEAVRQFKEAVASSTGRAAALALIELAQMDEEAGNHEEAARSYLRVAILYPFEDLAAGALLAAGRELLAAGDAEQARKSWAELLERFPDSAEAREARGLMEGLDAPAGAAMGTGG